MSDRPALALIGGLDPSGGAGLLRDGWTATTRAPELEQIAVCTALTRQGQGQPARFTSADPRTLEAELLRVASQPGLRAVKLGMIPSDRVDVVERFLAELRAHPRRPWIVCDPLMAASDGGLLGPSPATLLQLAARVDLLTPNAAEAARLRDAGELPSAVAVLLKGEAVPAGPGRIRDRLIQPDGSEQIIERPRVAGPDPRGTGCALATAIACELARGRALMTAVVAGIAWLDGARQRLSPGPDGRAHLRIT